jgi:hypothetical protein
MSEPKKRISRTIWSAASISVLVALTTMAYAVTFKSASEKAMIRMLVLPTLKIEKYSDMSFRNASPGAKAEVISPHRAGAAGLKVVGYPNQAYTLFLPKSVDLLPPVEGAVRGVTISDFTSYPEVGTGLLGTQGQLENKLGATRNEIALDLPSGSYQGNYTLTVAFP